MSDKESGSAGVILSESPLAGIETTDIELSGVRLQERPNLSYFNLRGNADDVDFRRAIAEFLSLELPLKPNTVVAAEDVAIFWLSPDEWLIVTKKESVSERIHILRGAIDDQSTALTDISGGQTTFRLSGSNARRLLAKATTLDIHPRVFGVNECAQSSLAKAAALIHLVDADGPVFDLHIRRSFADYCWRWLRDSGVEFAANDNSF